MNIEEALRAARAAMNRVTDDADLAKIRGPLEEYRRNCRFLWFSDQPYETPPYKFESETAHVLTKGAKATESKDSGDSKPAEIPNNYLRRMQRGPGRETLTVPGIRLETRCRASTLEALYASEDGPTHLAERMPDWIGEQFLNLVERHVLRALMVSAKEGEHGLGHAEPRDLRDLVRLLCDDIPGPSTVIANPRNGSKIKDVLSRTSDVGERGQVVTSFAIGDDAVVVVADDPAKVGFVRVKTMPETYVGVDNVTDLLCTAVGEFGFCVWGDAPVSGIVVKND